MHEDEKVELMYRRPGREDYELLTDVVDDLLNRIAVLEARLDDKETK